MRSFIITALAVPLAALTGCASAESEEVSNHQSPSTQSNTQQELTIGEVVRELSTWRAAHVREAYYDGSSDDLLTAGLGAEGLAGAAPIPTDLNSAAQLRRYAIYTNYRALVDMTVAGGYSWLYGPNISSDGVVTPLSTTGGKTGRIAGHEYLTYLDDGTGRQNVTLMVQVPDTFDPAKPCIVTATSSGSRGVYGAIGTSGEWGLKKGCAVAYTDKGTGNGLHDLMDNQVNLIDGTRTTADVAGKDSLFTAAISDSERAAFNLATPDRVAYKHAHSQQNSERAWGQHTLSAVAFAFYILNDKHASGLPWNAGLRFHPKNTLVIASSVSNGAGAALAAAEQDIFGLIDGVAVTEPQIQPMGGNYVVSQGGVPQAAGKSLYDYFSYANLFQICAGLSPEANSAWISPLLQSPTIATNRCLSLKDKGLVSGDTVAEMATDALHKLQAYGWLPDSNSIQWTHGRLATSSVLLTYANAYGRFSVLDNVCGYSFANTDAAGAVIPQAAFAEATIFSTGNGVPPTSGVNIVYNDAAGGARNELLAVSPSTGRQDMALDGALCLRSLATGVDAVTGEPLTGALAVQSLRVRAGIGEVLKSANLRKTPTIIVQGRADTLVPVNHASRAYFARNQAVEGGKSNARYIEVTNGQHFDSFLSLQGYDSNFVPVHKYLIEALDKMYSHLSTGADLPPSQVVRTTKRGVWFTTATGVPVANPLSASMVPAISSSPSAADAITFSGNTLHVPN